MHALPTHYHIFPVIPALPSPATPRRRHRGPQTRAKNTSVNSICAAYPEVLEKQGTLVCEPSCFKLSTRSEKHLLRLQSQALHGGWMENSAVPCTTHNLQRYLLLSSLYRPVCLPAVPWVLPTARQTKGEVM